MARALLTTLITVVWAPLCCILVLLVRLFTGSQRLAYEVFRCWGRSTFWIAGIQRRISGLERIDPAQPLVYVANHPTSFEPLLLMSVIPGHLSAVGKKELKRMPIVGWVMMACGWLFIDRQNLESARRSIDAAAAKIRSGLSVLIFPEGRRTDTPRALQKFKKGPFHLALAAQVPIQPTIVAGWDEFQPEGAVLPRAGRLEVRFGQQILADADDSVETLLEKVRSAMERLHDKSTPE
jgi:1-acyl-sn-glycerol-3-phosphate acyltransferase